MFNELLVNDALLVPSIRHIVFGLFLGVMTAFSYLLSDSKKRPSSSFVVTMVVLPAVISVVITMVGSNMAKAISIAGVFALVRFRSVPGDARDIFYVFLAMAAGVADGMECYFTGLVLVLIIGFVLIILSKIESHFFGSEQKLLKITVPENMNIQNAFDEVFKKYLSEVKMLSVKTTNMGTLFQLTYEVSVKRNADEKAFLDELRVLNGNLNIVLGYPEENVNPVL